MNGTERKNSNLANRTIRTIGRGENGGRTGRGRGEHGSGRGRGYTINNPHAKRGEEENDNQRNKKRKDEEEEKDSKKEMKSNPITQDIEMGETQEWPS